LLRENITDDFELVNNVKAFYAANVYSH